MECLFLGNLESFHPIKVGHLPGVLFFWAQRQGKYNPTRDWLSLPTLLRSHPVVVYGEASSGQLQLATRRQLLSPITKLTKCEIARIFSMFSDERAWADVIGSNPRRVR